MDTAPPRYIQTRRRASALPVSSKLYQAIGALPDTFKNFAFNTFLLFLYSQILGLSASLASLALMISVVVDAVSDPLVGSYSDGLKSRYGRRHGLMFASILPLALTLYLLFTPPQATDQWLLFGWLLTFSVLSRLAMTLFLVPWSALFAELSDDYAERSSIITYRYLVGAIGGVLFIWCVWTFIFPSSEAYPKGQMNPEAYATFALVLALAVALSVFATSWLTLREIPYLRQPADGKTFGFASTLQDLLLAARNHNFMVLFGGLLVSSVLSGTIAALEIYFHTYFWQFSSEDLRWLTLGVLGTLLGALCIPALQKHFDKKTILLFAMVFSLIDGLGIIGARLLDLLPENGDSLLLYILVFNEVFRMMALTVTIIMFVSMVADTLDVQELETGQRQEGVFSAAISFSGKAVSGFGILLAGLLLEFLVGIPQGAEPDSVSEQTVWRLGIFGGIALPLLYFIPFLMATRYGISRERHAEIKAALAERY